MKSNAWWVCDKCGLVLAKPGKRHVKELMLEHRKSCHELACFSIKQVSQKTKEVLS